MSKIILNKVKVMQGLTNKYVDNISKSQSISHRVVLLTQNHEEVKDQPGDTKLKILCTFSFVQRLN